MLLSPLRVFPIDIRGRMAPEYGDARFEAKLGYRSTSWIVRQPEWHTKDIKMPHADETVQTGGLRNHKHLQTRWNSRLGM